MNEMIMKFGPVVGRFFIALIFLIAGYTKITSFAGVSGFIASKGLPLPEVLAALTIVIEVGGAAMIILGWKARLAATVMFLWLIPVTLVFHNFWAVDLAQYQNQFNNFMKNLAIMGGMLYIAAFGSGRYSLDK